MTGWMGTAEAVLAVIGLVWVLILALGIAIITTLHAVQIKPEPDAYRAHLAHVAEQQRQRQTGDVNWDAVRLQIEALSPADFNNPGGTK